MKRLLAEPLVHFLLLGVALFVAYALIERDAQRGSSDEEIVVTSGTIQNMTTTFSGVWRRPPTTDELKGLIDEHVKEEILSREAIKLGLDQNDTIIRRRLRQKMEFLAEDFAATTEPTEAELETYLREHPDSFREPPQFTFHHIFMSDDRGERLEADAVALMAQLNADPSQNPTEFGDRFLGPRSFTNETWQSVASQFGTEFAEQLKTLATGKWSGPIRSAYGSHLVLITARTEGGLLTLELAREQVKRELLADRRRQANQAFLEALLEKYQVTIDWPAPSATAGDDSPQAEANRAALSP